jgi:hypothetical protein
MRGILPAGAQAVLAATPDQIKAGLGTLATAGTFRISIAPPSAVDDGSFYLGNLLDPLATVAVMNTAIAAAVSGQAGTSQPARVSSGLLDGSAPATLTLLAAPHAAGLYRVNRSAFKVAAGSGGNMTLTHAWHDPDGGAQTSVTGSLALTGTGQVNLGNETEVVHSDGTAAITLAVAFQSPTGTPSVRVEGSVTPVG